MTTQALTPEQHLMAEHAWNDMQAERAYAAMQAHQDAMAEQAWQDDQAERAYAAMLAAQDARPFSPPGR